jgi:hypothetical protein
MPIFRDTLLSPSKNSYHYCTVCRVTFETKQYGYINFFVIVKPIHFLLSIMTNKCFILYDARPVLFCENKIFCYLIEELTGYWFSFFKYRIWSKFFHTINFNDSTWCCFFSLVVVLNNIVFIFYFIYLLSIWWKNKRKHCFWFPKLLKIWF